MVHIKPPLHLLGCSFTCLLSLVSCLLSLLLAKMPIYELFHELDALERWRCNAEFQACQTPQDTGAEHPPLQDQEIQPPALPPAVAHSRPAAKPPRQPIKPIRSRHLMTGPSSDESRSCYELG